MTNITTTMSTPPNCTSNDSCTVGSVFAGIIVGILLTLLILHGKWERVKIFILKKMRSFKKTRAVSNQSYEADFYIDPNAVESLQEDENYQNVAISENKSVGIVGRPPSDEIPGGDAVYAVSLKKVTKKPGLPTEMIQKIASLHENSSKIVARRSQEFEDFVDIEKKIEDHEISRSATLPTSKDTTKAKASDKENDQKKSNSKKGLKKKTSKNASISSKNSDPDQSQQQSDATEVVSSNTSYVMTEASANGEYFVLDKTFC